MKFPELGRAIRESRVAQGLTQYKLAQLTGLSRTTISQMESGLAPDLGIKKVMRILATLGIELSLQPLDDTRPDYVSIAARNASVSFKDALTGDELTKILLTGRVPPMKRPHMRALLDEAPAPLIQSLIKQTEKWSKPGRVTGNLEKIIAELKAGERVKIG